MNHLIDRIDHGIYRLLSSRHPALKALDRAFARSFGQVRLPQPAPLGPPAGNLVLMTGDHDAASIYNPILASSAPQIDVGVKLKGETARENTFTVVTPFSEGGMAKTYLVRDQDGREYLLKTMLDFSAAPHDVQTMVRLRFANEIGIMEGINNPHVVKLIDRDPQPFPVWYVMEKIKGKDLASGVPAGKKLHPMISLTILIHVLKGLVAFEEAARKLTLADPRLGQFRFAHRDLKPENILLEVEGRKVKRAVIIDFGIVKLPGSDMTGLMEFVGTLGWSAPENLLKGSKEADHLSDIYALGAICYWLFTGKEVINAEDQSEVINFAQNPGPVIARLRQDRPQGATPELQTFFNMVWGALFGNSDPAIGPHMKGALHTLPEKRYQSYAEFLEAVRFIYDLYETRFKNG